MTTTAYHGTPLTAWHVVQRQGRLRPSDGAGYVAHGGTIHLTAAPAIAAQYAGKDRTRRAHELRTRGHWTCTHAERDGVVLRCDFEPGDLTRGPHWRTDQELLYQHGDIPLDCLTPIAYIPRGAYIFDALTNRQPPPPPTSQQLEQLAALRPDTPVRHLDAPLRRPLRQPAPDRLRIGRR